MSISTKVESWKSAWQSAWTLEVEGLRARQRIGLFWLLVSLGTVIGGLHILDDGLAFGWLNWFCGGILGIIMGIITAKYCAHLFWFADLNRIGQRLKSVDRIILSLLAIPPLITAAEKLSTDWLEGTIIIFTAAIYFIAAVKACRHFAD